MRRIAAIGIACALLVAGPRSDRALAADDESWFERKVLDLVQPYLQSEFPGGASIGSWQRHGLRSLELHDLVIKDRRGHEAISVDRVVLNYAIAPLLKKRVELSGVEIKGLRVSLRQLPEGGWNLAQLTAPGGKPSPWAVVIGDATVDGVLVAEDLADRGPLASHAARVSFHAAATLSHEGTTLRARISDVRTEMTAPGHATLKFSSGALAFDEVGPRFESMRVEAATTGADLARLEPSIELQGKIVATGTIAGPLSAVRLDLDVRPESGAIRVAGRGALSGAHPAWHFTVDAKGLDPAIWQGAPHGVIEASAVADAARGSTTVEVTRLHGRAAGAAIDGSGKWSSSGALSGQIVADTGDLAEVARAAAAASAQAEREQAAPKPLPIAGRAHLEAHAARRNGVLVIDGSLDGRGLAWQGEATAKALTATAHFAGGQGKATISATGATVRNRPVDSAVIEYAQTTRTIDATVSARGPKVSASLVAHGNRGKGGRIDGTLSQLSTTVGDTTWKITAPARFTWSSAFIAVRGFDLVHDSQRLAVDGQIGRGKSAAIAGHIVVREIDVESIVHLFRPSQPLPPVVVTADLRASGTLQKPTFDGSLDATANDPKSPDRVTLSSRVHLARGRLEAKGSLAAQDATLALDVDAPVPIVEKAPLRLTLTGSGLKLERLRSVVEKTLDAAGQRWTMPPEWADLARGTITLDVQVSGTAAMPRGQGRFEVEWEKGNIGLESLALRINAEAKQTAISARLATAGGAISFDGSTTEPVRAIGKNASALTLPISSRIDGRIDFSRVHLPPSLKLPVSGVFGLRGTLAGTLGAPAIKANVEATDVDLGAGERIEVHGIGTYRDKRADAIATVGFRSSEVLAVRGSLLADLPLLLRRGDPIDGKIEARAEIDGYPLDRLRDWRGAYRDLDGRLYAHLDLAGTVREPVATGDLRVDDLSGQGLAFDVVTGNWRSDGSGLAIALRAPERKGGLLDLDFSWRRATDSLDGRLRLFQFDVAFLPSVVSTFRTAKGQANAVLALAGTRDKPTLGGVVNVSGGEVVIRQEALGFSDVYLSARLRPGHIDLEELRARSGGGTAIAKGTANLDGFRPVKLDATIDAKRFGIVAGTLAMRLDGHITAQASEQNGKLAGNVKVVNGGAHLPPIASGGKHLQGLGRPTDVQFVDARGRARAKEREKTESAPTPIYIDIRVPGPFALRGKDVNADANGELHVRLERELRLDGHIEAPGGWVDVLGRRFSIDHARLAFGDRVPINPDLDIRLTRQSGDVVLFIDVTGSASKPDIALSSDPPRYSQSEILGLLLSNDPGSSTIDQRTLDEKVVGALSGVVVSQLKDVLLPSLPVDVLKVELGQEGYTGLNTTRVEVGKYVSHDIYLSYVHQFGNPQALFKTNNNQASVEWRFARHFEVDLMYGDANVGAANFGFRMRF